MFSRSIGILFVSFLPAGALILPLSPAHTVNALVAGILAMVLAGLSMAYDRARIGTAIIGAWVALTAFIFPSTLMEEILTVSWGTLMLATMAGPLSASPQIFRTPAEQTASQPAAEEHQVQIAA